MGTVVALHRATHHTLHALGTALSTLELTGSEINALAHLGDGRGRNVRELAVDTGTRATTLTGVLDRLERRGYLTRSLDGTDRRSFRLALTRSGRAAAARVRAAVAELERGALAGVSARDLAGYRAVVSALQAVG
jgi:DNA-binding MarR family transcriptional regulator